MKQSEREERRKQVKELHDRGKTKGEIAKELNVSYTTILRDFEYFEKHGKILKKEAKSNETKKNKVDARRIKRLCIKFDGQTSIKNTFEQYILDCEDKFKQGTLKREEIETIKDVVILTDKYQDIVFYLKVCVRYGQVKQAMTFVSSQIYNETFTKEEQNKMRELKEKIIPINKEYIAIDMLKSGEGVEKARNASGLLEAEVLQLNRKLLQKAQRSREKEENDDDEEPKI